MDVLVVGASGLVGTHLCEAFASAGHRVQGTYRNRVVPGLARFDSNDHAAARALLAQLRPAWCLVPAAYSYVDGCERDPDLAHRENVENLAVLTEAALGVDAGIVLFSSDYVFDGRNGPYRETDVPRPLNVYGRTKLEGERIVRQHGRGLVVRTTVVYDLQPSYSKNFLLQLLGRLREGQAMPVAQDQWGNPTPARMLADATRKLVERDATGIYHVAGRDVVPRSEFALQAAEVFGLPPDLVQPQPTAALSQAAPRPMRSGFAVGKVEASIGCRMWGLREGLERVRDRAFGDGGKP